MRGLLWVRDVCASPPASLPAGRVSKTHRGSSDPISEEVLAPITEQVSGSSLQISSLCLFNLLHQSARSCKDFIAEVVSAWGMGEFAAGLEKQ